MLLNAVKFNFVLFGGIMPLLDRQCPAQGIQLKKPFPRDANDKSSITIP
jgi:hypothetical protein